MNIEVMLLGVYQGTACWFSKERVENWRWQEDRLQVGDYCREPFEVEAFSGL